MIPASLNGRGRAPRLSLSAVCVCVCVCLAALMIGSAQRLLCVHWTGGLPLRFPARYSHMGTAALPSIHPSRTALLPLVLLPPSPPPSHGLPRAAGGGGGGGGRQTDRQTDRQKEGTAMVKNKSSPLRNTSSSILLD